MKSEGKNAMQPNYNKTRRACYRGYIVQGVINNLSPLFFVIFQRDYQVTYGMLSSLILFNFVTQILVDVLCVKFVDRIGYRAAGVTAHLFSTVGLLLLGLLPRALLGQLALLEERSLRDGKDSAGQPAFLLGRRGYSSFRMYAADMDAVAPLAAALEGESMRISTQADRIEEIRRLDEIPRQVRDVADTKRKQ